MESLRFDAMDFMPESAEESRLRRGGGSCRAHGKDRARSARVSRLESGARWRRGALPPPPHSRRISVNWASDDRRRRGPPKNTLSINFDYQ